MVEALTRNKSIRKIRITKYWWNEECDLLLQAIKEQGCIESFVCFRATSVVHVNELLRNNETLNTLEVHVENGDLGSMFDVLNNENQVLCDLTLNGYARYSSDYSEMAQFLSENNTCLLYTSPSPRDRG